MNGHLDCCSQFCACEASMPITAVSLVLRIKETPNLRRSAACYVAQTTCPRWRIYSRHNSSRWLIERGTSSRLVLCCCPLLHCHRRRRRRRCRPLAQGQPKHAPRGYIHVDAQSRQRSEKCITSREQTAANPHDYITSPHLKTTAPLILPLASSIPCPCRPLVTLPPPPCLAALFLFPRRCRS